MPEQKTGLQWLYFRTVDNPLEPGVISGFWVLKNDVSEIIGTSVTKFETEEEAVRECANVFVALLVTDQIRVVVEDIDMKAKVFDEIVRQKEEYDRMSKNV